MVQEVKGYETVIRVLNEEDVDTVFTFMSDDIMTMLSSIEDAEDTDIQVVHTRHEQAAVAMADGYSRASGKIGVCIVGKGPAIAQTGTALVGARKRGSRVLVLVPESPLSRLDGSACKRFRQEGFLHATVGGASPDSNRYGNSDAVVTIRSSDTLLSDVKEAFRRLRAGEGPVVVQVSADVLDQRTDVRTDSRENQFVPDDDRASTPRLQPGEARVKEAVDLYLDSDATKPPVILAGMGAVKADARDVIYRLAEKTSALLTTTLQARGYFSDHPFSLGFVGNFGSNVANRFLTQSHYLLAVGCSLNPYTTDFGHLIGGDDDDTKIVHVDTDPASIGRYTPVDLGIVGDAKVTLAEIVRELERESIDRAEKFWTDSVRRQIEETPHWETEEFVEDENRIDPRRVVTTLNEALPDTRLVLTDAGQHARWIIDGIDIPNVGDFIYTLDFSAVGQGLPIGIGAATTTARRTCVTFCGDAGFMMALPEVETAVRNRVPIVIVVLNDRALGSEYHRLEGSGKYPGVVAIDTPDLAEVARSLGAEGYTIQNADDLASITSEFREPREGPVVVDCKVNRDVKHPNLT